MQDFVLKIAKFGVDILRCFCGSFCGFLTKSRCTGLILSGKFEVESVTDGTDEIGFCRNIVICLAKSVRREKEKALRSAGRCGCVT